MWVICSLNPLIAQPYYLETIIKLSSKQELVMNNVIVTITNQQTNEQQQYTTVDTIVNSYILELNQDYLIEFRHPAYYSKSIIINTNLPKKKSRDVYKIEIDVSMDENCEQNPNFADIIFKPIGRIEFNRSKTKFDYDREYTFRMGSRYDDRRKKRCAIVAEQERARKRIEKLSNKRNADTSIVRQIKEEEQRIANLEKRKAEQIHIFKEESEKEIGAVVLAEKEKKEKSRIAEEKKKEEELEAKKLAETRTPKFDETQPRIYIYPMHSWPSELAEYVLRPEDYKRKPIGTFTHDLQKSRKEFYIEDVEELRTKFPKQFNQAFKNWDYVYETNMKYKASKGL